MALFTVMLNVYTKCHYAEFRNLAHFAKCRYAEWRYADCRYAECRGAI